MNRPRILLADADAERRAACRRLLEAEYDLAEAGTADEALLWLEEAPPGITLLDHALPGAGGAALVGRIRELRPGELVVMVFEGATGSIGLCRAAMRAGAYDCLDRDDVVHRELLVVCAGAAERIEDEERRRFLAEDRAREAVRRHERQAAGRLCSPDVLAAWRAWPVEARQGWVEEWLRVAALPLDDPTRERRVTDLVEDVAPRPASARLLEAIHVHALASARSAEMPDAVVAARDLLLETLARLAPVAGAKPASRGASGAADRSPAAPSWCRLRISGRASETWVLFDGDRVRARVEVEPGGCAGWIWAPVGSDSTDGFPLPPLPEGLREVERRLGLSQAGVRSLCGDDADFLRSGSDPKPAVHPAGSSGR